MKRIIHAWWHDSVAGIAWRDIPMPRRLLLWLPVTLLLYAIVLLHTLTLVPLSVFGWIDLHGPSATRGPLRWFFKGFLR